MNSPTTEKKRPQGGKVRLLIVDDHPIMRRGLYQVFSELANMEVCGDAASAAEAMTVIEREQPDVALIDISLGQDNGLELIKTVRERFPDIKMLVHSMHDETLFAERVLRAGALGYVGKSEPTPVLLEAISQVSQGEVYLSERMTSRILRRAIGSEAAPPDESPVNALSDREIQVFEMLGRGLNTKQIATRLGLSGKTIESHRENIKAKLGLTNSIELTREAVRWILESG